MVVATTPPAPRRARQRGVGGLLPEPGPRVGAHVYAGKRIRDDVREGAAVMLFSAGASVSLATVLLVATRVAG